MLRTTPLFARQLLCHPQTPCAAVEQIVAETWVDGSDLVVRYRIVAEISQLRVPNRNVGLDPQRLWEHTCCELFVTPAGGDAYVEWNFSPNGQFARFEFSSYRRRESSVVDAGARVSVRAEPGQIQLEARAPLSAHVGESARVSLTAVIEDAQGRLSYWALRHPCDRPDFHHARGFTLVLTLTPCPAIVEQALEPS